MSEKAKTALNKTSEEPVQTKQKDMTYALETLRSHCLKLFGVTVSTFDAATYGLEGSFTKSQVNNIINKWQSSPALPKNGGKK